MLTPLHVRSGYSLLRGTASPQRLIELAKRQGHRAMALTDVNNLCGATAFHKLAREYGLAPIIGAELAVGARWAVALVFNQAGYENLCRIITKIHCESLPDASFASLLAKMSQGLHLIVEDETTAGGLLSAGMDRARLWLGIDVASQSYAKVRRLAELAAREGLSPVATGKALLAQSDDAEAGRLLTAIRTGKTFDSVAIAECPPAAAHLRSDEQLMREFHAFAEQFEDFGNVARPLPDWRVAQMGAMPLHARRNRAVVVCGFFGRGKACPLDPEHGICPALIPSGVVGTCLSATATARKGMAPEKTNLATCPYGRGSLEVSVTEVRTGCGPFLDAAIRNNLLLARQCTLFNLLPRRPVFPNFPCPDGLSPGQYLRQLCLEGAKRRYCRLQISNCRLNGDSGGNRKPETGGRNSGNNNSSGNDSSNDKNNGGRPPSAGAVMERLDRELEMIDRLGFNEYFLVVWDIVCYARGAPVAGRGSGASSLVAYVLGITNVCPLEYDIPFERFLHAGREDFPDLDVDFCWRIRDDVINYAFERWGADHVAMVSMHGTFQEASALRETAKAFGMSDEQISKFAQEESEGNGSRAEGTHSASSAVPVPGRSSPIVGTCPPANDNSAGWHGTQRGTGSHATRTGQTAPAGRNGIARIARLSRKILGLPHNLSVHPGGIVIAPLSIDHYVPIQPAAKGVNITQFDKNGVEDIRLVKLDLLGNRNLSTVRYACDLIRSRRGIEVDIESLPGDDEPTVAMLQSGQTVGCNQLESPAMRHLLKMMQPRNTRDVMKALALIRPGAASIGMKEVFIRRHRAIDQAPADHPAIAAILGDTHGVMLYEDDVMLVAAAMLGSTLSEADKFRKAVQKCHDDRQRLNFSEEFLRRCQANGFDLEYAKGLWVQMAKFNAYSFCRAHAASYAVLAYAGAYLKAHFTLEFWVAALNNNQSMYPHRVYVEQAKRQGIGFLPPDVNRSEAEFTIEEASAYESVTQPSTNEQRHGRDAHATHGQDARATSPAIRVGLSGVGGLGPVHVEAILKARRERPFEGLSDCLARSRLGRNEARSLILCGAFDWTARSRPTLMMEMNLFFALGSWRHSDDVLLLSAGPNIPNVPMDYSEDRKYFDQRHILGLSVGEHFVARCRGAIDAAMHAADGHSAGAADADSRQVQSRIGRRVRLAGVVEAQRTAPTKSGETVIFLTMEDEFGLFEVLLAGEPCRAIGVLAKYGPYIVTGQVKDQYGAITVEAESIELVTMKLEE